MARILIVNADDFGATRGINRGIVAAYRRGIVTSTSLMVTTPASDDAAALARANPGLSVGLHVDLPPAAAETGASDDATAICAAELRRQLLLFEAMTGRRPTHLDSHHNSHCDPRLLGCFLRIAGELGLPLRNHSPARYFPAFYGRWAGEMHAEQIGVAALIGMLDSDVGEGVTELSCHPGLVDGELHSDYTIERELELQTLCDPAIARALRERAIVRIGFQDLGRVAPPTSHEGA